MTVIEGLMRAVLLVGALVLVPPRAARAGDDAWEYAEVQITAGSYVGFVDTTTTPHHAEVEFAMAGRVAASDKPVGSGDRWYQVATFEVTP